MLRYDAPTQALVRVATRDVTLRGQRIARGDTLLLMLGAANRDPAQFPEPDRFDITRTENRHLSFGMGIHFCAGAPLARIEGEVALRAILGRFPRLRLAPGATLPRSDDWMLRSARRIPLDTSDIARGAGEAGATAGAR
ncbi:MAG: cytochrome P450 [Dehalococcoidia bacterium]|nr:cytochrome P450 [Dehalococcoidia bacterium]